MHQKVLQKMSVQKEITTNLLLSVKPICMLYGSVLLLNHCTTSQSVLSQLKPIQPVLLTIFQTLWVIKQLCQTASGTWGPKHKEVTQWDFQQPVSILQTQLKLWFLLEIIYEGCVNYRGKQIEQIFTKVNKKHKHMLKVRNLVKFKYVQILIT